MNNTKITPYLSTIALIVIGLVVVFGAAFYAQSVSQQHSASKIGILSFDNGSNYSNQINQPLLSLQYNSSQQSNSTLNSTSNMTVELLNSTNGNYTLQLNYNESANVSSAITPNFAFGPSNPFHIFKWHIDRVFVTPSFVAYPRNPAIFNATADLKFGNIPKWDIKSVALTFNWTASGRGSQRLSLCPNSITYNYSVSCAITPPNVSREHTYNILATVTSANLTVINQNQNPNRNVCTYLWGYGNHKTYNCIYVLSQSGSAILKVYPSRNTSINGTINGSISASINVPNATIVVGQSENITANITNGTAPFTYQWKVNGASVGTNSSILVFNGNATTVSAVPDVVSLLVIDSQNLTANATANVSVAPAGENQVFTTPVITCPKFVVGAFTTCSVTIAYPFIIGINTDVATGNVTFTTTSASGFFTGVSTSPSMFVKSASCVLSSNMCSIIYADNQIGTPTITAIYSGDPNDAPSANSTKVNVTDYLGNQAPDSVLVSCPAFIIGSSTNCTATVIGAGSPVGQIVFTTSDSSGSFVTSNTCALIFHVSNSCSVIYTDNQIGTPTITATYSGDLNNQPASGNTIVNVSQNLANQAPTTTELSCPAFVVGSTTNCTATVFGFLASGNITFASSDSSTTGSFLGPSTCDLSSGNPCSVIYSDSAVGTPTITAIYSGDLNNQPSSNSVMVNVEPNLANQAPSSTSVSCANFTAGTTTICTASVSGFLPQGTMVFGTSDSTGFFITSNTCTLTAADSCNVIYSDSAIGTHTITAIYSGDLNNAPSTGKTNVTVNGTLTNQTNTTTTIPQSPAPLNTSITHSATNYVPTGTIDAFNNITTGGVAPYTNNFSVYQVGATQLTSNTFLFNRTGIFTVILTTKDSVGTIATATDTVVVHSAGNTTSTNSTNTTTTTNSTNSSTTTTIPQGTGGSGSPFTGGGVQFSPSSLSVVTSTTPPTTSTVPTTTIPTTTANGSANSTPTSPAGPTTTILAAATNSSGKTPPAATATPPSYSGYLISILVSIIAIIVALLYIYSKKGNSAKGAKGGKGADIE